MFFCCPKSSSLGLVPLLLYVSDRENYGLRDFTVYYDTLILCFSNISTECLQVTFSFYEETLKYFLGHVRMYPTNFCHSWWRSTSSQHHRMMTFQQPYLICLKLKVRRICPERFRNTDFLIQRAWI